MIARLKLGSSGPRLGGGLRTGAPNRHRRTRWALVVVSKELYCESAADEWSGIAGTGPVLVARRRDHSYTASSALREVMHDAGLRGLLVPRAALRSEARKSSRERAAPLRRVRRLLRLARRRFRQPARGRAILVQTALALLLAAALWILVVASVTAADEQASLAGAKAVDAELTERTETLKRLRDEATRLQAGDSGWLPALPGRLVSALVSTLAPGERINSVAVEGHEVTLVAEGGLGLVARIDSLENLKVTGNTVTERGGTSVITIRARQEGGDR